MSLSNTIFYGDHNPEEILDQQLHEFISSGEDRWLFAIEFEFDEYYLTPATVVELVAVVEMRSVAGVSAINAAIFERQKCATATLIQKFTANPAAVAHQFCRPLLALDKPLLLQPVAIPKPWGQEIWYTGIEERGLSEVTDGVCCVPLPWLLALAPQRLAAGLHRQLNLLKILDPLPDEVYGDLYFELHEKKQEVYVVTHVDKNAWPDGVGAIRFGFDKQVRERFASDAEFTSAYSDAVDNFQQLRQKIDAITDQMRLQDGFALNEPVSAEQLKIWHQKLPSDLLDSEIKLRASMERFSSLRKLRVGDVVTVPILTPHALQHGVRTVEFQTPVYERKILSFGQKVLTQTDWDTKEAVALMSLQSPEFAPLLVLESEHGYCVEQVVKFDDFLVRRITLSSGHRWRLDNTGRYALVMAVNGGVQVVGRVLAAEQTLMLAAVRESLWLESIASDDVVILLAEPI